MILVQLDQEKKRQLDDLLTNPGFEIYQELLEEQLDIELQNMEDCEDIEAFMWCKGRVKLLKQTIIHLAKNQLEEEIDERPE